MGPTSITCLGDLAAALKAAREERRLSQAKVCGDLGLGRTWLNNVENGTTLDDPGFNRLMKLASYYGFNFTLHRAPRPTLDDMARDKWSSPTPSDDEGPKHG